MTSPAFRIQPRLDGFLDWIARRKPKAKPPSESVFEAPKPGELEPKEGREIALRPEELPASVFEAPKPPELEPEEGREIIPLPEAVIAPPPREEKRSIFDALRPREESAIAPVPEKPSIFSALAPQELKAMVEHVPEEFKALAPEELKPIIEYVPKTFEVLKPSPAEQAMTYAAEVEPFEAREARQMEMWTGLFPETPEEEKKNIFEGLKPITEKEAIQYHERVAEDYDWDPDYINVLPLPPRNTLIPDVIDVCLALSYYYDLEKTWNDIREFEGSPEFSDWLDAYLREEEYGDEVECPKLFISHVSTPHDVEYLIPAFFGVPKIDVLRIGEAELHKYQGRDYYEVNEEAILCELTFPLEQVFTDAFDRLKPDDIKGSFHIEYDDGWGGVVVNYRNCGRDIREREMAAVESARESLERELEEIENELANVTEAIPDLQRAILDRQNDLEAVLLKLEKATNARKRKELTEEADDMTAELESMNVDLHEIESKYSDLAAELSQKRAELERLPPEEEAATEEEPEEEMEEEPEPEPEPAPKPKKKAKKAKKAKKKGSRK